MISVITWDAGFRESYHTVDYFSRQTIGKDRFEFIWADYYETIKPELEEKIRMMSNGHIFCLRGQGKWHLGRCLNSAVKESVGELLVIPDGDILVDEDFLEEVALCHEKHQDLVLYFRRWDQRQPNRQLNKDKKDGSLYDTEQHYELVNPSNYGGCISISRKCFDYVGGYEEHSLFSEAGANGKELYIRLKNAGFPIMWHAAKKIFHPWHDGTTPSNQEYKRKVKIQDWFIQERDLKCVFRADTILAEEMLHNYSNKRYSLKNSMLGKLISKWIGVTALTS